ncbi:hypothetical protein N8800_00965 [Gammaproteobacteria bacterium]|nr:hypothetical protein [Gammaproteobacteria bacterium]
MIDLYFSYRSPYSYLILPRMLKLKNEHNVEINFKIVYPLAIRMPEWFKNKNLFFFIPFIRDFSKKAKKLNMPLKMPIKPDPIKQNPLTGKISSHQPYIFDICHMGQFMCNKGKGIEFAYELSSLIWGEKNWNKDELLGPLFARFDENLSEVREYIKLNEKQLVREIEMNQADQKRGRSSWSPFKCVQGEILFWSR